MVDRYKPGGDFWLANPGLPQLPLTDWQIWNEPNLFKHWTGKLDPRSYARFLERIRGVILDEDPDAGIVLAGMPQFHQEYPCIEYLKDLYEVKGVRRLFDTVAVNAYMRRTKGLETAMRRLRALMDKNGDDDKDIWITEMGWASDGPEAKRGGHRRARSGRESGRGLPAAEEQGPPLRAHHGRLVHVARPRAGAPHPRPLLVPHRAVWRERAAQAAWFAFTDFTGGDPGVGPIP